MSRIGNILVFDHAAILDGQRNFPPETYDDHPTADVFYYDAVLDCAGRCQHDPYPCREGCCRAYSCPAADTVYLDPCPVHNDLRKDKRRKWWRPPMDRAPPMVGDAPPQARVVVA